ncbi:BCNT-domain-containing protein [Lophiostoma macrostomum CBS 122681]|uniref:SWR1-complex protein 5 n=1 Tax=Lophiostoma macrostomum CBS 122681 TaxID=1314788 RepID=A0A6A6TE26_9PLEO|nr:BCNT-domain-containing protein [Lophiostoma macrostomum CBS 122681]
MALHDPVDDLADEPENYRESSDEDFNPTAAAADDSSSSSDEDAAKPAQRKGKRKAPEPEDLDSGDEVTIEAARKRKAKRWKGGKAKDDDDLLSDAEGGEGGLIKTRAQRAGEQKERRPLAHTEGATIDVDALWAQMAAAPLRPSYQTSTPQAPADGVSQVQDDLVEGVATGASADPDTDLVAVRKVYTFAGQRTTEEKQVPRSKLEQLLSEGWKTTEPEVQASEGIAEKEHTKAGAKQPKVRRPLRRPSRFDPNPTGYIRALPPEHQLSWPRKATVSVAVDQENTQVPGGSKAPRVEKAQKLNVVDKSRLDWTGFVDKEGIADELDVHGKTKEAYLGRMDFLAGVEARQEEERRRVKPAAAT